MPASRASATVDAGRVGVASEPAGRECSRFCGAVSPRGPPRERRQRARRLLAAGCGRWPRTGSRQSWRRSAPAARRRWLRAERHAISGPPTQHHRTNETEHRLGRWLRLEHRTTLLDDAAQSFLDDGTHEPVLGGKMAMHGPMTRGPRPRAEKRSAGNHVVRVGVHVERTVGRPRDAAPYHHARSAGATSGTPLGAGAAIRDGDRRRS